MVLRLSYRYSLGCCFAECFEYLRCRDNVSLLVYCKTQIFTCRLSEFLIHNGNVRSYAGHLRLFRRLVRIFDYPLCALRRWIRGYQIAQYHSFGFCKRYSLVKAGDTLACTGGVYTCQSVMSAQWQRTAILVTYDLLGQRR